MVISRSTTAGMDSYITAIPAALTGNLIAKAVNRYRDRQKYADFKVIKEVANGYRSIESLLSEEQVHAIRQTSEKLEESIMSGKKLNEKEFNETLRETIEVFDKNPRVYFPLIADWTSNHIKEKIDTFFLQRQLKEFYEFSCPEGTSAISCGYFGEGGKNKVRLYSREGDKLNIGIIEWKNLELITEGGENTGIKISPPLVQIEESTVWNSDYRSLAQRIEQDKPKGVIMYSSGMIVPDALKKIMLTEVFSERYRVYLESKNKPPITKV
jgi:hypothetical protein